MRVRTKEQYAEKCKKRLVAAKKSKKFRNSLKFPGEKVDNRSGGAKKTAARFTKQEFYEMSGVGFASGYIKPEQNGE